MRWGKVPEFCQICRCAMRLLQHHNMGRLDRRLNHPAFLPVPGGAGGVHANRAEEAHCIP